MTTWSPDDLSGLTRPWLLHAGWPAPVDLRTDKRWLSWDVAQTSARGGIVPGVAPGLVERFAGLSTADDCGDSVREFAAEFGPLGLSEEGRPLGTLPAAESVRRLIGESRRKRQREPLDGWRCWSERVDATLPLVGAITGRRKIRNDQLIRFARSALGLREENVYHERGGVVSLQSDFGDDEIVALTARNTHRLVAGVVSSWLHELGVGVGIDWPDRKRTGRLVMTGAAAGCLPMIIFQLALLATRSADVVTCSGCGVPFTPSRAPRTGQRSFCANCRAAGVPVRLAQRDVRVRRSEEKNR